MNSKVSIILLALVLSVFSTLIQAAVSGDECGRPSIDPQTDRGLFIWKNCDTDQWYVIASSDQQALPILSFEGIVSADNGFDSVEAFNLEDQDSVEYAGFRAQIDFNLNTSESGRDGFTFKLPQGDKACFNVTAMPDETHLHLGYSKMPIGSTLNLQTLGACYNFVFFLMDDMRWNNQWAMPIMLDKLASRGVSFTNAFITTPLCCPARANILSGGYYSYNTGVLQVTENIGSEAKFRENNDKNTIATKLQRAGYETFYAGGKYLNGYAAPYIPPGWSKFVNNVLGPSLADWFNFDVVTGSSTPAQSAQGEVTNITEYVTNYHKDQVIDFIKNSDDSPFLVFFSVFAPHDPATPDKQDEKRFLGYKFRERGFSETDFSDKPSWVSQPDRARHVKSESKIANQSPLPTATQECGRPEIDPASERGLFIWKTCDSQQWSMLATAGGQGLPTTSYEGIVRSDQTLDSVSTVDLDPGDVVDVSTDPTQISFSLNIQAAGKDGFIFNSPEGAQTCFDVTSLPEDSQIYIGSSKLRLNSSLNLTTLQPCYDDEFHVLQLQSMQSVDRAIGEIYDEIEAKGKLNDTVFIFMSDHGYLWGEHGLYKKAMAYEESIRTPLVFVMPGILPRKEHNLVAADIDVAATMLDLAAVKHLTDGDSLAPLLENINTPWKSELYFQHWGGSEGAFGTWAALRNKNYKYIKNALDEIELYDLKTDPYELESLHESPGHQLIIDQMDARLDSRRGLAILAPWRAPKGKVGESYKFQLTASGGTKPYFWSILEGQLPAGLKLNPLNGLIFGTPMSKPEAVSLNLKLKTVQLHGIVVSHNMMCVHPVDFIRWRSNHRKVNQKTDHGFNNRVFL